MCNYFQKVAQKIISATSTSDFNSVSSSVFFPLLLVNMYLENLQQLADFAIPFPDTVKDVMENAADHVQKMENPVQSRDYQKI